MKNLTVKKIALGLFLAGYAASSAFAITSTTEKAIQGNVPVMKSYLPSPEEHTMTVKIYDQEHPDTQIGTRPAKVGDIIEITFKLEDADGDIDTNKQIKDTLQVFIKKHKTDTAWTPIAALSQLEATVDGEEGKIKFTISNDFSGAELIGYKILERTTFGDPYFNNWLAVTDIWNNTEGPATSVPTDNKNPLTTGPADPGDGEHGPGDSTNNGTGPVESELTKVGIFKYNLDGSLDKTKNYAVAVAAGGTQLIPHYGDKFAAVVWLDDNNNGVPDGAEMEKTTFYKFQWKLSGEYKGDDLNGLSGADAALKTADGVPLTAAQGVSSSGSTGGVDDELYLGSPGNAVKHNTIYTTAANGYRAGAQGYKITVTSLNP